MANEFSIKIGSEPLLAAWIKWTMDRWDAMDQMGPGSAEISGSNAASLPEVTTKGDAWLSSLKLWQAFFSLLTEPKTVAEVFEGIRAPSEIVLRMAQVGWGGYCNLHRQWLESREGGGTSASAEDFEDFEKDAIKICNNLCESDFRRWFNIPLLRLTPLSQESLNCAIDKFNLFQSALAEFISMLYMPVHKALAAIWAEEWPEPREDFKEYYKEWLKILEGHYMTFFQSTEFVRALVHTLNAFQNLVIAKDALLAETMEGLSLPSRQNLDELYREMYLLKKSMKDVIRKLDPAEPSLE